MTIGVRADVFPATFKVSNVISDDVPVEHNEGARSVPRVRVVVTEGPDGQVLVFSDDSKGPKIIYSARVLTFHPPVRANRLREAYTPETMTYTLTTPSTFITFIKEGGCGCGSRLKSFNPFPAIKTMAAS